MFYVCFFLKTPYLVYIVDSLTLNSWATELSLISEGSFVTHIFFTWHITVFLHLETLGSTSILCFWTILSSKSTKKKKKPQKCKGQGTKRTYKYYSVYKGWNRKWGVALFDLTWECKKLGVQVFCQSTCLEMTVKAPWILIWRLNLRWVDKSANMETMDN